MAWNKLELYDYPRALGIVDGLRQGDERTAIYRDEVDRRIQQTDDKAHSQSVREQADWIARTGAAILKAPPDQRPNLYGMALEDARQRGYDTTRLPPQYDAATEGYIRFNVDKVRAFQQQQTRRGRGGAPGAGGAGAGLDPPYQPQAATPPDAAAAPPVVSQPAPARSQPPLMAPRGPVGGPTAPQAPPAPVGPAPGAAPPVAPSTAPGSLAAGGQAPSVTLGMPPLQGDAPAPPSPGAVPQPPAAGPTLVQDSGQDPAASGGIPAPPKPGPDLQPGDRIVRGRGGAPRVVGGMLEVRDKDGQPAFRPIVRPQAAPQGRAPAGFRFTPTGDLEPIPGGPRDPANPPPPPKQKPLTDKARRDLKELGDTTGAFVSLTGTFDDKFGGYGSALLGDADLGFKARISGDTKGADWWKLYQAQKNIVRHDLFGAALTKTEKGEFEKADIHSGLRADVIRNNLNTRTQIMLRGMSRIAASMQADGYNRDAIEAAVGMPLDALPPAVNDTPDMRAAISRILGTRPGGGAPSAAPRAPAPAVPPGNPDLRKKYGLD